MILRAVNLNPGRFLEELTDRLMLRVMVRLYTDKVDWLGEMELWFFKRKKWM